MEIVDIIKRSPSLSNLFEELLPVIEAIESGIPVEDASEEPGLNEEVIGELDIFEKALLELLRNYSSEIKNSKETSKIIHKATLIRELLWNNIRTRLDEENERPDLSIRHGYKVTSEKKKCDCDNCDIKSICPIKIIELVLHR